MGTLLNRRRVMGGGGSPVIDTRMTAIFDVTSTTSDTCVLYNTSKLSLFTGMWVDGEKLPSVIARYRFSTLGEHEVKYQLADQTTLANELFRGCSDMTKIVIPNGVLSTGSLLFYQCTRLAEIVFPETLVDVGMSGGGNSIQVVSLEFPDSVKTIAQQAFNDCKLLEDVRIGNGIESIGNYCFIRCTALESVTIEATTPPSFGGDAVFNNNASNRKIYVPAESVELYKAVPELVWVKNAIEAIPV